nr:hypothetical protein [Bacteroidota bacterium]
MHFDHFTNDGGILNAYSMLKLARAHLEIGDTLNCIDALRSGIRKGLLWSEPRNFLSITHGFNDQQLSWLDPDLICFEENRKIFLDRLDDTLIQKIYTLADQDQEVRLHRVFPIEEHTRLIHSTDSITLIELRTIFLKYDGFPPDSLLNRESTFNLMLLIHHAYRTFPDQFDYFISVVVNAINAFQLHPSEYAVMVDRRQYIIDRCSIYGEVPYHNTENISFIDNIKDLTQVDQLRYAVGLPSLNQHASDRDLAL